MGRYVHILVVRLLVYICLLSAFRGVSFEQSCPSPSPRTTQDMSSHLYDFRTAAQYCISPTEMSGGAVWAGEYAPNRYRCEYTYCSFGAASGWYMCRSSRNMLPAAKPSRERGAPLCVAPTYPESVHKDDQAPHRQALRFMMYLCA